MRVTMKTQISGTRDGEDWPAAGETIDLPAAEAEGLIANKLAVKASAAKAAAVAKKASSGLTKEKAAGGPPETR